MKVFKSILLSLCFAIFSVCVFCACDGKTIVAEFNEKTIDIVIGEEYNPYSFIQSTASEKDLSCILFDTANHKIAYVSPEKIVMGVNVGQTKLSAYYNDVEICSVILQVKHKPVQFSAPYNIKYDQNKHCLTWDYSSVNNIVATKYKVEIQRTANDGKTENSYKEVTTNEFPIPISEMGEYGEYKVRVQALSTNKNNYLDSEFTEFYKFRIMATPVNLVYTLSNKTLKWEANGNPEGTKYQVIYKINNEEKIITTSETSVVLPELKAGEYTVKVKVLLSKNCYANESKPLTLKKLAKPIIIFDNGKVTLDSDWDKFLIEYTGSNPSSTETITTKTTTTPKKFTEGDYTMTVTAVGDTSNCIYDSEPATKNFKKLPTAIMEFNNSVGKLNLSIVNALPSQKCKISLINNNEEIFCEKSSTYTWNLQTTSGPICVKGQILANDSSCEIDGDIAEKFTLVGDTEELTEIQNLPSPNVSYKEENGDAILSFTPDDYCSYSIDGDIVLKDIPNETFGFKLGKVNEVFGTEGKYFFEIKVNREPSDGCLYLSAVQRIDIIKLPAPESISLNEDGQTLKCADVPNASSFEIKVNDKLRDTLNLEASVWNISARYIAKTTFDKIEDIDTYYTSSNATEFSINRIEIVSEFTYNYQIQVFSYNTVENAKEYRFYVDNTLIGTSTENTFDHTDSSNHTVSVVAVPSKTNWSNITSDSVVYYESLPVTCKILQSAEITNLTLSKDDNGQVVANWKAPKNEFEKDIKYKVLYKVLIDGVCVDNADNLENTSFTFDINTFNEAKTYEISVELYSPESEFFAPTNNPSVKITKLKAPEKLTIDKDKNLSAEINGDTMTGINVDGEFQGSNVIELNLENGQSRELNISFEGKFNNEDGYYLTSDVSTFKFAKLKRIENLNLTVDDALKFTWTSPEGNDSNTPEYLQYNYYVTDTGNSKIIPYSNTSNNQYTYDIVNKEIIFYVKEIPTNSYLNATEIFAGNDTYYFACDEYSAYTVEFENNIENLKMQVDEENNVDILWTFTKKLDDIDYTPKFCISLANPNGNTENEEISDKTSTKYTKSYNISTFDSVGEYKFSIYVKSDKTLTTEIKTITINKLAPVSKLKVDENKAILVDENETKLDTAGIQNACVSVSENTTIIDNLTITIDNLTIDLSSFESNKTYEIDVYLKAIDPNAVEDKNYYLDSASSTFKIMKLEAPKVTKSGNELTWDYREYADSYDMEISSADNSKCYTISKITVNSIDLTNERIVNLFDDPGTYNISVRAVSNDIIIKQFDEQNADNTIGVLTSEFGDCNDVEKLAQVGDVSVSTDANDISQKVVTISWVKIDGAKEYNVYLSTTKNEKGTLLSTVTAGTENTITEGTKTTIFYTNSTNFGDAGYYYICVEAIKKGAISGNSSNQTTIVRLDSVASASIDNSSLLTWKETNQIASSGFPYSYIVEILDENRNSKKIYGKEYPLKNTNLDLVNDTFLKNVNGKTFGINLLILGNGTSNGSAKIATLSSNLLNITGYKFFKPEISICNNTVFITSADATRDDVSFKYSIKSNKQPYTENDLYTNNPTPSILDTWLEEEFIIEAYAVSSSTTPNLINSQLYLINSQLSRSTFNRLESVISISAENSDPEDLTQSSITVTWNNIADAENYDIILNDEIIHTVDTYSYDLTDEIKDSGVYKLKIVAKSSDKIYSLPSSELTIVRLNSVVSASMNDNKVITVTELSQNSSNYQYLYYELVDKNKNLIDNSGYISKDSTTYDGFQGNEWLSDYDGGTFGYNIYVIGNGSGNLTTEMTLTSPISKFYAYKLFAPDIIYSDPSKLQIETTNATNNILSDVSVAEVSANKFTIKKDDIVVKDDNGNKIENRPIYSNGFLYPDNWLAGDYFITAKSCPETNVVNVLSSKESTETLTRLDNPKNLTFYRTTLNNNENYHSDSGVETYFSDILNFKFDGVENAVYYQLFNDNNEEPYKFTNGLEEQIVGEFENFLNNGVQSQTLYVQAVAEIGSKYINSKKSKITYKTIPVTSNFEVTDGKITWETNPNANCYLIKGTLNTETPVQYWQSSSNDICTSGLPGLFDQIESGSLVLNIKNIGNVTTTGLTAEDTIILDSPYQSKDSTFTKLGTPKNLFNYLGFISFDKVTGATSYVANIYDKDEKLLKENVILEDYSEKVLNSQSNKYIAYSTYIQSLTPETLYKIKIQSRTTDPNTIYSDYTEFDEFNIKLLENANPLSSDIELSYGLDLTKTKISAKVSANSYGLLTYQNECYEANHKQETAYESVTDLLIEPRTMTDSEVTCLEVTYTFGSLGGTGKSETDGDGEFYYLSSSMTSHKFNVLGSTTIYIENGIIKWETVDQAVGYYVYIGDNLYKGKIYYGTELDLSSEYGGDFNQDYNIKIVAVTNDGNTLYGPTTSYNLYYQLADNNSLNSEKIYITKLKKPAKLGLVDGSLIWNEGITFENYSETDYRGLLLEYINNPSLEKLNDIESYLEKVFSSPIVTYSRYTGLEIPMLNLTFTNLSTETKYNVEISASNFWTITEEQKNVITSIKEITESFLQDVASKYEKFELAPEKKISIPSSDPITYDDMSDYLLARIFHFKEKFLQSVVDEISPLYNIDQNNVFGFPNAIPSGEYSLVIQQHGNNFSLLNSNYSDPKNFYIPSAPLNLEMRCNDKGDFSLRFDKVNIPASYNYNAKLNELENSTDTVYILYGENEAGKRVELTRTVGEPVGIGNRLSLDLTDLVDRKILTTKYNKIFLVVAGDNNQVITGRKSEVLAIEVLPVLAPYMSEDGSLILNSLESSYKFEISASSEGCPTITKTIDNSSQKIEWLGDELREGASYNVCVRSIGNIYSTNAGNFYVISGERFEFILIKLNSMDVSVNEHGVFNWEQVGNALGFIVTLKGTETKYFVDSTTYEATDTGYNTFMFRALGSSGPVEENNEYYISSKINNDEYGLECVMLGQVDGVEVSQGVITWKPLSMEYQNNSILQEGMTQNIGYRLTVPDLGVFYTDELYKKEYYTNEDGKLCFDLTNYGSARDYTIKIQPFIYFENGNKFEVGTTLKDNSEYYQLLGEEEQLTFTKIPPPTNIHIENGEFVWSGNTDDKYYIEILNKDNEVIESADIDCSVIDSLSYWVDSDKISTSFDYKLRIKAYKQDCVYSVFADFEKNEYKTFKKLDFNNPVVSYTSDGQSNSLTFTTNVPGVDVGFNIKYKINDDTEYSYLYIDDDNYDKVVETESDSADNFHNVNVKIKINKLRERIDTMQYSLQLVPIGNTRFLKSDWTQENTYQTPTPIEMINYDTTTNTYYWDYQGPSFGYIIRDKIYDNDDNLLATYFYKIERDNITTKSYYKVINGTASICFMPVVVGYKHLVEVAVTNDLYATNTLISGYCEYTEKVMFDLFKAEKDLFGTNSSLKTKVTETAALEVILDYAYGTSTNPYTIKNETDFANINKRLKKYDYLNSYVVSYTTQEGTLEMTVDVTEPGNDFYFKQIDNLRNITSKIGEYTKSENGQYNCVGFDGIYDGDNYLISYTVTAKYETEQLGLFVQLDENAVVKNVKLDSIVDFGSILNSSQVFGSLTAVNYGTITNVCLNNLVVRNLLTDNIGVIQLDFGGIVGTNYGTIEYTVVKSDPSNPDPIVLTVAKNGRNITFGGISASNASADANIRYCGNEQAFNIEAKNNSYVGAITGQNHGNIFGCYNKGDISGKTLAVGYSTYVGGIAGKMMITGRIEACYATGSIHALNNTSGIKIYAGGIVGQSESSEVMNCYSSVGIIVVKEDQNQSAREWGGTLFGEISTSGNDYYNYYVNDYAVGSRISLGNFTTKVDLEVANALQGLINNLNKGYSGDLPFKYYNNKLILNWENNEDLIFNK